MRWRAAGWMAAAVVAAAAFVYGAVDEGPPKTNADRARALAEDFACPVCAGQSVAESDVPVAREIRRQIAVWVDEGRSDAYIRDELVAAYDVDIDYNPSGSGITSLVWILPVLAGGGIAAVLVVMLRSGRGPADAQGPRPAVGRRRRGRNAAAWTVAVVVVAGAAGLLVARSSGSRSADGSVTGEIRVTTRELIFEAQSRLGAGDMAGAIAAYDEALELQPSNVEALTYRGWLTSRRGAPAEAVPYLDDAIAVDPDYPDARLFRAIVALEEGDSARAATELAVFDSLDPPPYAEELMAQSQVRERVAAARNAAALLEVDALADLDERPAFSETALSVPDALVAAEALAGRGDLLEAVQFLDWALESRPDDPDLLAGRGWLLVRSGDPELLALGVEYLDTALAVDSSNARGLVYRAFARWQQGNAGGARTDLSAFDALQYRPPDLVRLIEAQGMRDAIGEAATAPTTAAAGTATDSMLDFMAEPIESTPREDVLSALRDPFHPDQPEPLIDLAAIREVVPPDAIPALEDPAFEPVAEVQWLAEVEPVLALEVNGDARAYPLRIMTWHELVNGTVGGVPVTVSYCPLCNSAVAYDRRAGDRILDFGTSGALLNSSLVMYDRQTESLWSHYTGQAVAGHLVGTELDLIPVQTVSFEAFLASHPDGRVLSLDTGHFRRYGQNPYEFYDSNNRPFLFGGPTDDRLEPITRVVALRDGAEGVVIPNDVLAERRVVPFTFAGRELVALFEPGTASALDNPLIAEGRDVGATGVFVRSVDGQLLDLSAADGGGFIDAASGVVYDILGRSSGTGGAALETVEHLDTFWFAAAAFYPDAEIIGR